MYVNYHHKPRGRIERLLIDFELHIQDRLPGLINAVISICLYRMYMPQTSIPCLHALIKRPCKLLTVKHVLTIGRL
jgi:hypothetical protein